MFRLAASVSTGSPWSRVSISAAIQRTASNGAMTVLALQLALAILADHAGDEIALRLCEQFKTAVVARLPAQRWTLSRDDIDHALAVMETTGTDFRR